MDEVRPLNTQPIVRHIIIHQCFAQVGKLLLQGLGFFSAIQDDNDPGNFLTHLPRQRECQLALQQTRIFVDVNVALNEQGLENIFFHGE